MIWNFDFHTESIAAGYTLEEYLKVRGTGYLGLHLWEAAKGNRSDILRFRHEHAHFTSFVASGLADLYGVFSDYLLVLTYVTIRRQMALAPGRPLTMPLLAADGSGTLPDDLRGALLKAWKQISNLRALLFGFGTRAPLSLLLDSSQQDDFWATHFELRFTRIVERFYKLIERLGRDAPVADSADHSCPRVVTPAGLRSLSARSVMEAYAISVELMNTHFRGIQTNLLYTGDLRREPGALYTVAIEHLLANGVDEKTVSMHGRVISWDDFVEGQAPQFTYYLVAALAFASMQVPVLQNLNGEVTIGGAFSALSPAHRFCRLVEALREGEVGPLPPGTRGDNKQGFLEWLRNCHRIVGDGDSMTMCERALKEHEQNTKLAQKPAAEKSFIETSWAARANFFVEPNEYVTDGGLFTERYGCQVRCIRTKDGKLVTLGADRKKSQAMSWADNSALMLEAAVFGEQWESIWPKFTEWGTLDFAQCIRGAIAYAAYTFGDHEASDFSVPEIELRQ